MNEMDFEWFDKSPWPARRHWHTQGARWGTSQSMTSDTSYVQTSGRKAIWATALTLPARLPAPWARCPSLRALTLAAHVTMARHPVTSCEAEPMWTNVNQFKPISKKTMAIWFNHVKSWGSAGLIASLPEIWAIWRFLSHRQWLGMSVLSRGQGIQGRSTRCVRFLTARSIFWHLRYLQVNHCR